MDTLKFETGGFPMSTERLASMQQCWKTINEALVAITGGDRKDCYVVSGCGVLKYDGNDDAYFDGSTDGFIVVRGELLPFKAGGRGDYVVVKSATTEELAYQDGNTKTFRTSRYATLQLTPDSNNLTIYDFDPDNGRRSFSTLWEIASRKTALNAALNRIAALEQGLAALNTLIDTNNSGNAASLSALQKQLVPKGTIIMWAQALPLNVATKEAVISGMGAAYGYIPCGEWSSTKTACQAWNGYFAELGLPADARWTSGQAYLSFPYIVEKLGLKCPNMSGKFPLGTSGDYPLGKEGGEKEHKLTIDEMPKHRHSITGWNRHVKHSSDYSNVLDGGDNIDRYTDYVGGDKAHNNMPPYYPLNFLIKVI